MPLSPGQQRKFRALENDAWALHCERSGVARNDRQAFQKWHQAELKNCTGKTSTKELGNRDFDVRLMPHFEALAENGIGWNANAGQADAKRLWNTLGRQKFIQFRSRFANFAALEKYALAIAENAGMIDRKTGEPFAELYRLTDAQMTVVTRSLVIAASRAGNP